MPREFAIGFPDPDWRATRRVSPRTGPGASKEAIKEESAYRRISGNSTSFPSPRTVSVDSAGRNGRWPWWPSTRAKLDSDTRTELLIVGGGARRDLGDDEAARSCSQKAVRARIPRWRWHAHATHWVNCWRRPVTSSRPRNGCSRLSMWTKTRRGPMRRRFWMAWHDQVRLPVRRPRRCRL